MFCLAGFLYLGLRFIIMCTRQPSLFRPRLLPSVRRTAQRSQRFLSTFIQLLKSLYRTKSSTVSLLQTSQISSPLALHCTEAQRHRGRQRTTLLHGDMEIRMLVFKGLSLQLQMEEKCTLLVSSRVLLLFSRQLSYLRFLAID